MGELSDAALSADKRTLAVGTLAHGASGPSGWVLRRDARTGALLGKWRVPNGVANLALSRDQKLLATVGSGRVVLWAWPSGKLLRSSIVQAAKPMTCDFSPDGKTLAVTTSDLLLFDVGTWKRQPRLPLPDPPFVHGAVFAPGGKKLVTLHDDIGVGALLWDLRTRRSHTMIDLYGGALVFSPDGRRVAASTYGDTSLYDARSGRRLKSLQNSDNLPKGVDNPFRPLAFSPDSRLLLGCGDMGRLEIWDAPAGRRLRVLPGAPGAVFWVEPRVLLVCQRDSVRRISL